MRSRTTLPTRTVPHKRPNTMAYAPVLFISHGAPTFAIEPGLLGPRLQALGQQLTGVQAGVKAVLVVSPHWQTRDVQVMTTPQPATVHDFGGFPARLYEIQYPVAGAPELAHQAADLLTQAGFATSVEDRRGLDHGAWVPLYHMLPQRQIPVFQVSMPYTLTTAQALALGRALAPLRAQGVVVVGSGSMTHNLREFDPAVTQIPPYVQAFSAWVRSAVHANAVNSLVHYRSEAPHAVRAHPTEEHFLPLLVALGARSDADRVQLLDGGVEYGILSMDSYAWGMPCEG